MTVRASFRTPVLVVAILVLGVVAATNHPHPASDVILGSVAVLASANVVAWEVLE